MRNIKDLTFKKKVGYIWDYYKLHIIVTVVSILIISSMVYSSLHSIKYVFNVSLLGCFNTTDSNNITKFESNITNLVIDNPKQKKEQALVESYSFKKSTDSFENLDSDYIQKFTAKIAAGEVDVLILGVKDYEKFKQQGAFIKLDYIVDLNANSLIYGINVENSKILKNNGLDTTNKVATIIASTKHKDNAIKVLKWLAENN